jgi:hypothetical protein
VCLPDGKPTQASSLTLLYFYCQNFGPLTLRAPEQSKLFYFAFHSFFTESEANNIQKILIFKQMISKTRLTKQLVTQSL